MSTLPIKRKRTYWHLEGLGRRPTDYEIASTRLTFAPAPGSSVAVPMAAFFRVHGPNARLRDVDWERVRDPLGTTYARYVERQRDREHVVQSLLDGIDASGYDAALSPAWRDELGTTLSALRFAGHGLQMLAAYLGRLATASPVIIAFAFQAADEMRRVQRFAYRLRQLVDHDPSLPERGQRLWHEGPAWQPMRRLLEELLVTWDWAECFVATNLLLKPLLDELILVHWPAHAAKSGDPRLPLIAASLYEDCKWHADLSFGLAHDVATSNPDNRLIISDAVERWQPVTRAAIGALRLSLVGGAEASSPPESAEGLTESGSPQMQLQALLRG